MCMCVCVYVCAGLCVCVCVGMWCVCVKGVVDGGLMRSYSVDLDLIPTYSEYTHIIF